MSHSSIEFEEWSWQLRFTESIMCICMCMQKLRYILYVFTERPKQQCARKVYAQSILVCNATSYEIFILFPFFLHSIQYRFSRFSSLNIPSNNHCSVAKHLMPHEPIYWKRPHSRRFFALNSLFFFFATNFRFNASKKWVLIRKLKWFQY